MKKDVNFRQTKHRMALKYVRHSNKILEKNILSWFYLIKDGTWSYNETNRKYQISNTFQLNDMI